MGQLNAMQVTYGPHLREARQWLYKTDYPRHIDQYIDFFGTRAMARESAADRGGELVLELPA